MRASTTAFRLAHVAIATCIAACSEDAGPTPSEGCTIVSPEGGALSSTDGVLTIAIRPHAVASDVELCIEEAEEAPDGPPSVFSDAYRVRPDIDLEVDASITFTDVTPDDVSTAVVGAILREDFKDGEGRWIPLETTRLEPDAGVIAARDDRLSMFYGVLSGTAP